MVWVLFIVELALSIALIAVISVGAAFQGEYLRFSTPLTKVIDGAILVLTLAPCVLTVWSMIGYFRGHSTSTRFALWSLVLVVCGGLAYGSLMLKERVGFAAKHAAEEQKRVELRDAVKRGDGEAASALISMGPPFDASVFAVYRGYVDAASDASERFRRVSKLTSGGWLTMWPSDDGTSSVAIPKGDQEWFVTTLLQSMLEARPGSSELGPAADDAFNDLLCAGTVISGVLRRDTLEASALHAGAALIPKISEHYRDRLALADARMPERAKYFRDVLADTARLSGP